MFWFEFLRILVKNHKKERTKKTGHHGPLRHNEGHLHRSKGLPFFEVFLKSRFQVSLYTRRLEIRKIFRLSQNSTKFFWVTRFRETNLTTQSVSSSKIKRIL